MCSEVSAEARKCGMCAQRRTPNPAYYCSEACAKRHWKTEHKAWHAQVKQDIDPNEDGSSRGETPEGRKAAKMAESDEKYDRLVGRAIQAKIRGNHRDAVKLLTKAAGLLPASPFAHFELGTVHLEAGVLTEALPHFSRALDLSDRGTEFHNEKFWAQCALGAFSCIFHPHGGAGTGIENARLPMPAQMGDEGKLRLAAERVLAVRADTHIAYRMRAYAYGLYDVVYGERQVLAHDLRQGLRDQRRIVQMHIEKGDSPEITQGEEVILRVAEAKLRECVAADVAASVVAADRLSV